MSQLFSVAHLTVAIYCRPRYWLDSQASCLTISTGGVISGTGTTLGSETFKVSVTDSQTPTAAVDIVSETITVNPPLSITTFSTFSLTAGSIGVPYSGSLAPSGGVPPYT